VAVEDDEQIDYEEELREAIEASGRSLTVPELWAGIPGRAFGGFLAGAVLVGASEQTGKTRRLSPTSRDYRPAPVGQPLALAFAEERRGRGGDTMTARISDGDKRGANPGMGRRTLAAEGTSQGTRIPVPPLE